VGCPSAWAAPRSQAAAVKGGDMSAVNRLVLIAGIDGPLPPAIVAYTSVTIVTAALESATMGLPPTLR
jgi:hypothetical protein